MKIVISLYLSFLLGGVALATRPAISAHPDDSIQTFWQTFKAAAIKGDKERVAALSKFPIRMSYGIASIRNKVQLRKRFREVFNQQTDAAKCFGRAQPEIDAGNPKRFTVACPDAAGNEVVIYHFEHTRRGWRFTGLDNLNE